MELNEALSHLGELRQQIARTERFCGYRSLPVAGGGVVAIGAAVYQHAALHNPASNAGQYLSLWMGVALVSGLVSLIGIFTQSQLRQWTFHNELTSLACQQFAPCVVAGGLLTAAITRGAANMAWMLPGLWAVVFSLGLFASHRLLPRAIFGVATFYLVGGCVYVALGESHVAFSPWSMAILFGGGQLLAAAVLYHDERSRS